jgi:Uma2 family endonuclease
MTALPQPPPQHDVPPLTLADYLALPEEADRRFELQEGALVMTPSPTGGHQNAGLELAVQIRQALPDGLKVLQDLDVDLGLVPPEQPATVRKPDLVVVPREAFERIRNVGTLTASEVLLAIETISPSSRRTDSVMKHSEYADAGIGHYWMIDLTDGPSLTACHLGGEFGYVDAEPVKGVFETDTPFAARIDLDRLVR